jgi:hypothetical protein
MSEKIGKSDAIVMQVVKRKSVGQKNNSIRNSLSRGIETLSRRQRDNFGKRTSSEVLTTRSMLSLSSSNCDTTSTEYVFTLCNDGPLSSPDVDIPLDEPTTTDSQQPSVGHEHKSSTEQDHESSIQQDHESSVQHDHESSVQHGHESISQQDFESLIQQDHDCANQQDDKSLIKQDDESSIEQDDESSIKQDHEEASEFPNVSEYDWSSELPSSPDIPPSITIQARGTIFIDTTVNIADCLSSETGLHHFCIRMLTTYDATGTHATVKEPCNLASKICSHIMVSSRSHLAFKNPLPYSVPVKWRHGPTLVADATFDQHIEPENLVLQLSDSCDDPELHTQIDSHLESCMHYAACCELSAKHITNEDESSDTAHNADANDAQSSAGSRTVDSEAQTMPQASEEDETAHALGLFTHLPCVFCSADAVEPLLDADDPLGIFIDPNRSLGYMCQKCHGTSWLSGKRFASERFASSKWSESEEPKSKEPDSRTYEPILRSLALFALGSPTAALCSILCSNQPIY